MAVCLLLWVLKLISKSSDSGIVLGKRQPCSCYVTETLGHITAARPLGTPASPLANHLESTVPVFCQVQMCPAFSHVLLPPQTKRLESQETVPLPFSGIGWLPHSGQSGSSRRPLPGACRLPRVPASPPLPHFVSVSCLRSP